MSETFDKFDPNDWADYLDPTNPYTKLANDYGITNPVDVVSYNLGFKDGYAEGYGDGDPECHDESCYLSDEPRWVNREAFDAGYLDGVDLGVTES